MAKENVQNNGGKGNLEVIKAKLKADFDLDSFPQFASAVCEIEKVQGPLTDDQAQALGKLYNEEPAAVSLVMECRRDTKVCEATKALLSFISELEDAGEGAGVEFLKGLIDLASEEKASKEEVNHV